MLVEEPMVHLEKIETELPVLAKALNEREEANAVISSTEQLLPMRI
jgi:hypothetical protein